MATSNTLIIAGLVILFIGIIILIIGISLYESNLKTNTSQPWYVWFLIIGGIFIGLVGTVMFVWGLLSRPPTPIVMIQTPGSHNNSEDMMYKYNTYNGVLKA